MTSSQRVGQWTYDCQVCSFTAQVDTEHEALNVADAHVDGGPGHFDFEITDPEGEVKYP